MAGKQVQRRRGSTAQHAVFTGALAEVTVDTDKKVEVVHDGATPGGFPMASARDIAATNANVTAAQTTANTAVANAAAAQTTANTAVANAAAAQTKANTAQTEVDALETVVANNLAITVQKDSNTGAAVMPKGNSAQRPSAPVEGQLRYNSQLSRFEGYQGNQWAGIGGDSMPLFFVMWWPNRAQIPAGFTAADGQLLNRATYPDASAGVLAGTVPIAEDATWLSNGIYRGYYTPGDGSTTFRVPDLNGMYSGSLGAVFLRGDGANSAGTDGVIQQDALQSHTHNVYAMSSPAGSQVYNYSSPGIVAKSGTTNGDSIFNATTILSGRNGPETRPLNVTGCWCVKLFGAAINSGSADVSQLASDVANLQANKANLHTSNNFSGVALRFQADFSSGAGAYANRFFFQSNAANGQTMLGVAPNGTATTAGIQAFASTNLEATQVLSAYITPSGAVISSGVSGAAAPGVLSMVTNGQTRLRLDTNGLVRIANDIGGAYGTLMLNNNAMSIGRQIRIDSSANVQLVNNAGNAVPQIFQDNGDIFGAGMLRCSTGTAGGEARVYRVRDANQCTTFLSETEVGVTFGVSYLIANGQRTCGPSNDGATSAGWALARYSTVFAVTGTINTSDAREKTPVAPFSDAELAVAKSLAAEIGVYKWLTAIENKGMADSRYHIGMTAQRVVELFTAQGLDAYQYGLLCYDAWAAMDATLDPDGNELSPARPAGDRFGLRYDELNQFILRGVIENQNQMETRLAALEAAASA